MDCELVDRCLRGDEGAWSHLLNLVQRLIGGLAATRWFIPADREELAQEVLVELLRNQCRALRQFSGRSRLITYLGAIVIRVAGRQQRRWGFEVPDPPELPEELSDRIEQQFTMAEMRAVIWQTLSPVEQLILRLDASGYTAEEIASLLSRLFRHPWTATRVRQRKARALQRLRRVIVE
ncbi:MAG: sigma-70 family RNA polymerase sigma factor [Anaerolineae bacterium]|nr:sigma-70 family RNA polymerase sigma factor [Anaerolineae bacterium]